MNCMDMCTEPHLTLPKLHLHARRTAPDAALRRAGYAMCFLRVDGGRETKRTARDSLVLHHMNEISPQKKMNEIKNTQKSNRRMNCTSTAEIQRARTEVEVGESRRGHLYWSSTEFVPRLPKRLESTSTLHRKPIRTAQDRTYQQTFKLDKKDTKSPKFSTASKWTAALRAVISAGGRVLNLVNPTGVGCRCSQLTQRREGGGHGGRGDGARGGRELRGHAPPNRIARPGALQVCGTPGLQGEEGQLVRGQRGGGGVA